MGIDKLSPLSAKKFKEVMTFMAESVQDKYRITPIEEPCAEDLKQCPSLKILTADEILSELLQKAPRYTGLVENNVPEWITNFCFALSNDLYDQWMEFEKHQKVKDKLKDEAVDLVRELATVDYKVVHSDSNTRTQFINKAVSLIKRSEDLQQAHTVLLTHQDEEFAMAQEIIARKLDFARVQFDSVTEDSQIKPVECVVQKCDKGTFIILDADLAALRIQCLTCKTETLLDVRADHYTKIPECKCQTESKDSTEEK